MRAFSILILGWVSSAVAPPCLAAQAPVPDATSQAGPPLFRPPGSAAVLAVATPRWVGVATEPSGLLGDFRFLPESSTQNTRGQVFQVLEADGGGVGSEAESLQAGYSFIAVPWTLGCGCAEVGWGDTVWVSPGDTVAFLLTPSRESPARDGAPVFDVLGWHQPYPAGEMIAYWRRERLPNPDWLTARDFFDLLALLPTEARFRLDPEGSYDRVLDWVRGEPGRDRVFPVTTLLQMIRPDSP